MFTGFMHSFSLLILFPEACYQKYGPTSFPLGT
jgi:hypothetical protein